MPREMLPLKLVGGNHFGRYPKISQEETFNMIISDGALVDYAGYQRTLKISDEGTGRGAITSVRGNFMLTVVGGSVFKVGANFDSLWIGSLNTTVGSVWMAENNTNQIAISDNVDYYVYNYVTNQFENVNVGFPVGYVSYQNGRILAMGANNEWRLSAVGDAKTFPAVNSGLLQTKPDKTQAAVPVPGKGNYLYLFGKTVVEAWTDVGGALFPYQRASNFNVDFGCINPNTIASLEEMIVWVGMNEKTGLVIFASQGGNIQRLSTDGIDFKLTTLQFPEDCSAFLFKQDGHLIYQVTWPRDNLTYIYDFYSKELFTVTDENLNYHIAKNVVFFNGKYYFVSYRDGWLYEFGTNFTNLDGQEMPRLRVTPPLRQSSQDYFRANSVSFTVENGQWNDGDNMAIDLAISTDGAENFGNSIRYPMNQTGDRKSRMIFWLGCAVNDLTIKVQFNGLGRYVVFDGGVEVI